MKRWGAIVTVLGLSLTGCARHTTDMELTDSSRHSTAASAGRAGESGNPSERAPERAGQPLADNFAPIRPYESPQAAFEASISSQMKGDHDTSVRCLDPESQWALAGEMAVNIKDSYETLALNGKRSAPEKKHLQPMLDASARHGLTEEAVTKLTWDSSPDRIEKMQRSLLALVKDPARFLVDYLSADNKIKGIDYNQARNRKAPRLTDVKVEGDRATGTAVHQAFGKEKKEPVEFTRVGGGWRIHLVPRHDS